jgi:hypothetical protein
LCNEKIVRLDLENFCTQPEMAKKIDVGTTIFCHLRMSAKIFKVPIKNVIAKSQLTAKLCKMMQNFRKFRNISKSKRPQKSPLGLVPHLRWMH